MQKVTAFLEKNVQWVAIGLGSLYLLWMVYAHVLNASSMDVNVGGQELSPGKVDNYVLNNVAQPLADKIKSAKPVTITVPDFGDAVNLNTAPPPALAMNWTDSQIKGPQIPDLSQNPNNPANPNQPGAGGTLATASNKVTELPKPPAPTDLATAMGRTSVYIPPQVENATFLQAQQAATAAPPAGGAAPQPPQQPQQQQQQPPQLQQGPNGQSQLIGPDGKPIAGTDIDWVSVSYKIHMQDLANEFTRCNIPAAQQGQGNTCFLDVELHRQEQLPNGQWGNETIVPKLTTSDQPPMPDEKQLPSRAVLQAYVNWAMSNLPTLLHPAFYTFIQGDQWMLSSDLTGMTVVADNGDVKTLGPQDVRPGFDANAILAMTPAQRDALSPPLTQKERQLVFAAADAKRTADAKARAKANTPTPRSNRGGNNNAGAPAVGDTGRPPTPRPFNGAPGTDAVNGAPPEDGTGAANPAAPPQPPTEAELLQKYQQMFPLPSQADFDPRTMAPLQSSQPGQPVVLVGWAHDATAQPGKTYRYAVVYKIKSPVWATFNTTKPPALVDVFALASAQSEWTQPVAVPPVVRFYFASSTGGGTMPVEVYRWQNGTYHKATIRVSPGDPIGKTIDNVDFATNFTVVDFRSERDDTTAWLLNPDGQLVRRDCKTDANSSDLNQMRKLYEQQQQQQQLQLQQQQQQNGQPAAGQPGPGQANVVGTGGVSVRNQTP